MTQQGGYMESHEAQQLLGIASDPSNPDKPFAGELACHD